MANGAEYVNHCRKIAERFLQTAVVVDDEAYMRLDTDDEPAAPPITPSRNQQAAATSGPAPTPRRPDHRLSATSIIQSFAKLGVICGVVAPADSALNPAREADIVILDWQVHEDDGEYSRNLLVQLLSGEVDRHSLRLVAFYTGESRLTEIRDRVIRSLTDADISATVHRDNQTVIVHPHGRIVLYAKSDVSLDRELRSRVVAEGDLPDRLATDFTEMVEGLLPSIALVSLTAVRESARRVLDRFDSELDPAFLAQRASISNPDEAEQQIVNHVAEELRGLMDDAVADQTPAGSKAIKAWVHRRAENGLPSFQFGDTPLTVQQTVDLAKNGLAKHAVMGKNEFQHLSAGFAQHDAADVDKRLAWIMSFRAIFDAPPPTLWLGTVLTELDAAGAHGSHLLCMRPRCDSLRLKGKKTSFFFLTLQQPSKGDDQQIVLKIGTEYVRQGISLDAARWVVRKFTHSEHQHAVVAEQGDSQDPFVFQDSAGTRYAWSGELKSEYAQRVAQAFAGTFARVAIDDSEWLRRVTNTGG